MTGGHAMSESVQVQRLGTNVYWRRDVHVGSEQGVCQSQEA